MTQETGQTRGDDVIISAKENHGLNIVRWPRIFGSQNLDEMQNGVVIASYSIQQQKEETWKSYGSK